MFDPIKSLEKHLGEFDLNSRIPFYNDSSDYTTNAPSYYDDLARKNKLIKHLALRIWDYDKELQKRFEAWDKNLEEFDDEVLKLLEQWMADGTFDKIINENIFGNLNDRLDNLETTVINLLDYVVVDKELSDGETDITSHLNAVVAKAKREDKGIYFPHSYESYYLPNGYHINKVRNIIADGKITVPEDEKFIVSYDHTSVDTVNWHFNYIDGYIRLMGLKNANVEVNRCETFELYAESGTPAFGSISYSQFTLGHIRNFRIFSEGNTSKGWINENTFYGGRMFSIFIDGNYGHNNNTFIKPQLELCDVKILRGGSNTFHDVRFEAENSFYFAEGTHDNVFYRTWVTAPGYYLRTPGHYDFNMVDEGTSNGVFYEQDNIHVDVPIFQINHESKNFNVDIIRPFENGSFRASTYGTFFESQLIPIESDIGVLARCDQATHRFYVECYDANREKLIGDMSEFVTHSSSIAWNFSENMFRTKGDLARFGIGIFKNTPIKYIKVMAERGSNALDFRDLSIFVRIQKRYNPPVNQYTNTGYYATEIPYESPAYGSGYFEKGDYVTNKNYEIIESENGNYVLKGWIRLTTGDSHDLGIDWVEDKVEV